MKGLNEYLKATRGVVFGRITMNLYKMMLEQ
jgi:hypothetical protein